MRGLASELDEYLCAEIKGEIVGFCAYTVLNNFWQQGQISYVYVLVVDEDHKGHGVGTMLMKDSKLKGCKLVELDSAFHRREAHSFYEKLGFEKRAYLFSKEV